MNEALGKVWSNKALWAIHVAANAALIAALYGWLWIPDSSVTDVVLSMAAGIGIVILVSWFHSGTLEFFRIAHADGGLGDWSSFRPSVRRVAVFALWLLVLCTAILLALQLRDRLAPLASWIASALTFRLRRPIAPSRVFGIFSVGVAMLAFIVVPFLMLQFWKWKPSLRFFLWYVAIFLAGAYVPYRLVWWIPEFSAISGQAVSMTVRFVAAYLLAVTAWLVLASMLGRIRSTSKVEVGGQTATNPG